MVPQTMSKYLSVKYLLISKQTDTLAYAVQKIDFCGVHFGGWHPLAMLKYFSVNYLHIKKSGTLA